VIIASIVQAQDYWWEHVPWGAWTVLVGALAFILWALEKFLGGKFVTPKQLEEAERRICGGTDGVKQDLKEFEHHLETTYVTKDVLNGQGGRIDALRDQIQGVVTLFTGVRDRADAAHAIASTVAERLEGVNRTMAAELRPLADIKAQMTDIQRQQGAIIELLRERRDSPGRGRDIPV
jgi:hypothetical protein